MMKRDDDHDAHRCHLTLTNEFILTLMRHWLEKGRQGSGCGCSSLIEMIAQSSSLASLNRGFDNGNAFQSYEEGRHHLSTVDLSIFGLMRASQRTGGFPRETCFVQNFLLCRVHSF